MTVVNPKSISGINSITMASGSDNLLTIHTTNTTERVRVNSDGDVIVGSGITVSPDGDIFATGVTTSTTFVGALTGNVTGNTSGTAGGLTGTPNISCGTIAGSTGTFSGDVSIADKIVHTADENTSIRFPSADTIQFETSGTNRLRIDSSGNIGAGTLDTTIDEALSVERAGNVTIMAECTATGSGANAALRLKSADSSSDWYIQTGNSVSGKLRFYGGAERMTLGTDGHLSINDGNLVFATSGHGIDFSATSDASGSSSELLHDYEEGTFTPSLVQGYSSITYNTQAGFYTKIGRFVSYSIYLYVQGATGDNAEIRISLPFTTVNTQYLEEGAFITYDSNFLSTSNDEKSNCYIMSGRNYTYLRLFKNNNGASIYGNDTTLGTGGNNTYLLIKGFLTTS